MLFPANSRALAGCGSASVERLSKESLVARDGGEGGGESKALGGRWLTMAVTVLITWGRPHVNNAGEDNE